METLPSHRNVIALAILALLLPLSFLGGYQLGEIVTEERIKIGLYEGQGIRVQLEVYKNGELVYVDYDDPSVKTLALLLVELLSANAVSSLTNLDNISNIYTIYSSAYPGYMFLSYDQNFTYSYTLNSLPASYDIAKIGSGGVYFDTTTKSVTLTASTVVTTTATVYGVGVYSTMQGKTTTNTIYTLDFLVFFDELGASAFTVNQGDVVTVVYKITVP